MMSLCILSTGCSEQLTPEKDPVTDFSCNADVVMNDCNIKCKIFRTSEGLSEIEVTSPEELNGLKYKWLGNNYSVSYQGLTCETQSQFLPDNSFAKAIVNALNETSKPESLTPVSSQKDSSTYSGNTDSGKFQITVDNSSGFIKELSFDDSSLTAKFYL